MRGVYLNGWAMRSLRHRFATAEYAVTSDIRAVQELLRRANLNTTQRYVVLIAIVCVRLLRVLRKERLKVD